MVPGGEFKYSHSTENKQVIENYASHKRRKLPIRGYLVRIRYTPFCPQSAQITVLYPTPSTSRLRSGASIYENKRGKGEYPRARLFQKADCCGPRNLLKRDDRKLCIALFQKVWLVKHLEADKPPRAEGTHRIVCGEDPASSAGYSPHRPMPSATESRCARPDRPRRGLRPSWRHTDIHPAR